MAKGVVLIPHRSSVDALGCPPPQRRIRMHRSPIAPDLYQQRHAYDEITRPTPIPIIPRNHDQSQSHADLEELFELIGAAQETHAEDILCRIRDGHSPESVLRYARHQLTDRPTRRYEQRLRQNFLINLVQSTAPLDQILHAACVVVDPASRITLPSEEMYRPFQDRILSLERLCSMLDVSGANESLHLGSKQRRLSDHDIDILSGAYSGPVFWVPTHPWTKTMDNNNAISHLVSLFLTMLNPYWRFVEEDLFLGDMRSGDLDSEYCSPFLVNAILAISSPFSEIDEAFCNLAERDMLSRGEHFHQEALRLRVSETNKQSIAYISGLVVMTLECSLRGKDNLSPSLARAALVCSRRLPAQKRDGIAAKAYKRAKCTVARSAVFNDQ